MEDNVADALKMAAAILLFVFALGVGISSFSQARQTIDTLISYADREYEYSYVEQNNGTQRIVTMESIIPVIYRSFKENYKIYFYENESKTQKLELYKKKMHSGEFESINFIDLQRSDIVAFGNDKQKEQFIMALLYGNKMNSEYGSFDNIKSYFGENYKITLNSTGLYDTIKERKFIEQIGEYYQEDEGTPNSDTPDANKTKKRIYTYIQINES